jgi:hypothetical protein
LWLVLESRRWLGLCCLRLWWKIPIVV